MTLITLGTWSELQSLAQLVRTEVFVVEQSIDPKDEWDEADTTATHAVVIGHDGVPLATARLLQPEPRVAQIGRMAVTRHMRGRGLGRQLVDALIQAAKNRGDHTVRLHAQQSAEGFYQRLGFVAVGEPYDEVGIAHVTMERSL